MSRLTPRPFGTGVLVVGLLALSGSPLAAQTTGDPSADERVGARECCDQLLFHIGARAAALGNALTARPGSDALFVNPAGLAGLWRDEFRVHNAPIPEQETTSNTFSLAFGIRDVGKIGLTYRLVDYGESEQTDDRTGATLGTLRIIDHMLLASFATPMAAGLTGGLSYKLFQFRVDCEGLCSNPGFVGTTHSVDAGVQYHPRLWPALQLGASIMHLGLPLQAINAEQSDVLPTRLRVGAGYELMHHFSTDSTTVLWATLDASLGVRQGAESVAGGGLELIFDETIFVRAGYSTGKGRLGGAAVGVGLRYDRFDVGIAKSFVSAEAGGGDTFQITFAVGF